MNAPTVTYVGNPAAHGAEWHNGSATYQLAVSRPIGDYSPTQVMFGMRVDGVTMPTTLVVSPERFGKIPTTRAEMMAYAQRFVAGRECAVRADHHSADLLECFSGSTTPTLLCGYHESRGGDAWQFIATQRGE